MQLLTINDLMYRYQSTRRTIYGWRRQGCLPFPDMCTPSGAPRWRIETIEAWDRSARKIRPGYREGNMAEEAAREKGLTEAETRGAGWAADACARGVSEDDFLRGARDEEVLTLEKPLTLHTIDRIKASLEKAGLWPWPEQSERGQECQTSG